MTIIHDEFGSLHVANTHGTLDLTIEGPPRPGHLGHPCTGTLLIPNLSVYPSVQGPPAPLLAISGGQDWRSVQACSLEDPCSADIYLVAGYWSIYGGWAVGTHPARVLSCWQTVNVDKQWALYNSLWIHLNKQDHWQTVNVNKQWVLHNRHGEFISTIKHNFEWSYLLSMNSGLSYVTPIVYLHWKLSWLVTLHRIM